jgi:ABC-type multidrug transport system ATPase subunit
MIIELSGLGKKFGKEWIFKNINYTIEDAESLAVLGNNGSGKSTLMQIIAAAVSPNLGSIQHFHQGILISHENLFEELSIVSPYMELIEEFSLAEIINFHFQFKEILPGHQSAEIIDHFGYTNALHKPIKHYSSGMKQRLKLLLGIFSKSQLLLLDEPCSNLDQQGISWYQELIDQYLQGRNLVVCSNQLFEYEMCSKRLNVMDYKGF